MYFYLYLKFF